MEKIRMLWEEYKWARSSPIPLTRRESLYYIFQLVWYSQQRYRREEESLDQRSRDRGEADNG